MIKTPAGSKRPTWRVIDVEYKDETNTRKLAPVLVSTDQVSATPFQRLHQQFDFVCRELGGNAIRKKALDYGEVSYSYQDLNNRVNQLTRYFQRLGISANESVALMLDRTIDLYATILALSKLEAVFVPLDESFPAERINFILNDCGASRVITLNCHKTQFCVGDIEVVVLDEHYKQIAVTPDYPFTASETGTIDPIAYIIYTSGSTGVPKGVPVTQSKICNFLHVASQLYGILPTDRVYQGLSVVFDFSFEEIWVPLMMGATLVPAPLDTRLAGDDLYEYLSDRKVTALCIVPTLLATLKPPLPLLRFLLVSGEDCPADVIAPWFDSNRRIINAYGPTETTVTATWSVLASDKPITIGGPLPSYSIVILDTDSDQPLKPGCTGEIGIAGVGLAQGYLNREDNTAKAFVNDTISIANNPGKKIYRTGDLGRINDDLQVEYLGRIDTQVKIRGYRIELGEIESRLRALPELSQAVVVPHTSQGQNQGDQSLVAYLVTNNSTTTLDISAIDSALRVALPPYMVPSHYEQLDELPMLSSDKVDRSALPAPTSKRFNRIDERYVAPRNSLQKELANLLGKTLDVDKVSVEADFFDDLGADSLILASYVAAIRKQIGIRRITMRKLYENTTVSALATLLESQVEKKKEIDSKPVAKSSNEGATPVTSVVQLTDSNATSRDIPFSTPAVKEAKDKETSTISDAPATKQHIPTLLATVRTGLFQIGFYFLANFAVIYAIILSNRWVMSASTTSDILFRAVVASNSIFFATSISLIVVKWLAVGRFNTAPVPLYSFGYVRFWVAQQSIRANPLNLFSGTPLYLTYLRTLGMSIGKNAIILCRPPVCTDLISIGDNTVIRQDSVFTGYTVEQGMLYPGRVRIGSDALICEATVLDINTSVGDGAQLGTTSALLSGQNVPPNSVWQGSPAEACRGNYDESETLPRSAKTFVNYTIFQLMSFCFISLPATLLIALLLIGSAYEFAALSVGLTALLVYIGGLVASAFVVLLIPRLLTRFLKPELSHPVFGVQYELARTINRLSNNRLLNTIFGDSSMIVHWLYLVGYDLSKTTQTGSNFGVDQRHHSPFLCSFDRNTLVSDGLLMMNMETSSTAFRMRQVAMPPDTYVGNLVHYPADSKLGPNCLIATKAAIPIGGAIRKDVGILGSPAFEIPRSVVRDRRFDHFKMPGIFEKRLHMKLKSNLFTLAFYVIRSWLLVVAGLVITQGMLQAIGGTTIVQLALALALAAILFIPVAVLFSIFCERAASGFSALQPKYCSLYDPEFWAHERFWKLNYNTFLIVFNGTPMKPFFMRLQGARLGRGVFDNGAGMTEPGMTEVGDHTMLNYRASLQCHSLEDGTFKSDRIKIGKHCSIGVGGFVHYGVNMQDRAKLDADAFLMKGSLVESGTHWLGNPARDTAKDTMKDAIKDSVKSQKETQNVEIV